MLVLARYVVLLALVTNLGLAVSTRAHVGDRVYPIAELTDDMLAQIDLKDGSVDDWIEVLGEPSPDALGFLRHR